MRGWRVILINDHRDSKNRIRAKAGDKGTIISTEEDSRGTVSVNMDGKHYPINAMPYSNLQRINDKAEEIPAGGWRSKDSSFNTDFFGEMSDRERRARGGFFQ